MQKNNEKAVFINITLNFEEQTLIVRASLGVDIKESIPSAPLPAVHYTLSTLK